MERYTLFIFRDDQDLCSRCSDVDESILMTAHILVLSSYGSMTTVSSLLIKRCTVSYIINDLLLHLSSLYYNSR